ncbi:hypothetical protein Nepgr_014939 [Nepenthes gracilis]|uniref:Uncharacterized protein n=1 Tax=Nepenthes gracilis TaxID=150966 RepID=A0AAD3SKF0_NEPGR|nr:hypothetical protein Nepgr_014939 [Nepenthes gracilis]
MGRSRLHWAKLFGPDQPVLMVESKRRRFVILGLESMYGLGSLPSSSSQNSAVLPAILNTRATFSVQRRTSLNWVKASARAKKKAWKDLNVPLSRHVWMEEYAYGEQPSTCCVCLTSLAVSQNLVCSKGLQVCGAVWVWPCATPLVGKMG